MLKPELVLSNTTTFFSGNLEKVFRKAKKYGFKYLEIIPYRWTTPYEISSLEKKYNIQVAGIHMPLYWQGNPKPSVFDFIFGLYLGGAAKSPGRAITESLSSRKPYLLLHVNVADEMGDQFETTAKQFHVLLENIPYQKKCPQYYWDPDALQSKFKDQAGLVFDPGHYHQIPANVAHLDILDLYRKISPEVIHISYHSKFHLLPNQKEQVELKQILQIRRPQYIVIETNPWVSVKKGKKMLEEILSHCER